MMQQITANFHISAAVFGNLTAFYYYSYTPMQLPAGVLIDKYGARLVLFGACLICVVGLFIFIEANTLYLAYLGRFLMGFGSAFAYITTLKLATLWLPPHRFATAAGLTTSFGMIAATISDIYLARMVTVIGYKDALYATLVIGVILSFVIFACVRNRPPRNPELVDDSPNLSYKEVLNKLLLIFTNRQMWLIGIIGALLYLPASVFLDVWGIPYLQTAYHMTADMAAMAISMVFLGWIMSSPLIGALSDKIKRRILPLTITSFASAIVMSIVFYAPHLTNPEIFSLFFLTGALCGSHPLCFSLSKENNPLALSGTATAATNCLIMMGGAIFQPVVGLLLDLHRGGTVINGVAVYSIQDYNFALAIIPIGLLLSGIITFFIKETHCKMPANDTLDSEASLLIAASH